MTGIVVTGHGNYADGVMSAVELVAGAPKQVCAVNFIKGEGVEDLKAHMIEAIQKLESQDIFLMVDILGGSPFNVAVQLLTEGIGKNLSIVSGVNVASMVQAVFMRENVPFDQLAAEVTEAGKQGVVNVSDMVKDIK